ncbi:MAG: hypothetical protein JNL67_01625 [Planctomycetaceae bacterium]|nr:hypothetical protein [Planctomycetaceae bacterium]
MSLEERVFSKGDAIALRMVDMQPPLIAPESAEPTPVDVVGTANLSADDASIINTFICEQIEEYESLKTAPLKQYHVHPHFIKGNGEMSARRYSCAGFVFEAYLDVGLTLVDVSSLPGVALDSLKLAYPDDLHPVLDNPKLRSRAGLSGDGPWPVLLPGYLFHSLSRDASLIRQSPYEAQTGDECFPRRESAELTNVDL